MKKLSQNQKTFNKVARHLLTQNQKSVDDSGNCLYRFVNEDGDKLRCGVGALIPDRLYDKKMEGVAPGSSSILWRTSECPVDKALTSCGHDPDFCNDLQKIHDDYEPSEWKSALAKFARKNNLKMVAPQA